LVRGKLENGRLVEKLELEAYEEKANSVLEGICNELSQARGIADVQIHHMLGEFESGEDLVYVLAAGEHRDDVFPVLKKAVERFKKEAPIFKKEYAKNEDGKSVSYWVGEKRKQ
jgi:molybdopterin synthase catalytic subunit